MTRIFPTLASLSLGLYLASIIVGLTIGDLYDHPDQATLGWRGVHMLTGTATALAVVFVLSIAVTYFVGTSRWCKEVTETYRLDSGLLRRSTQLKRQTFPWCVLGMLTVVVVGALGAASDPGTGRQNTADMADVHLGGSVGGDGGSLLGLLSCLAQHLCQPRGHPRDSFPKWARFAVNVGWMSHSPVAGEGKTASRHPEKSAVS